MSDEATDDATAAGEFTADPERVATLREIADDVRGETSESKQLANILYRTSDLYDASEDTSPESIVRNVKFILEVTERGGLGR
ncbi:MULTISPECIES: hypothetical protein [Natronorubrum]|uniref:Uncharacterized protein n=2 Tax=Natronorubrum TaxID=134813 RepID=A0A1N6XWM0_9EURY|nr:MULTISPECIES: hypothetical protein [Natronorubrum]APX95844.1 hypothetical protein BB347_03980 [Natronorubrum daqingense]SEH11217.1 hypothetical protein SAMN04487967_0251 [Natronorubrum sediminis]SIR06727.1 hypothetical protein SAMN05421809_0243 [Natronorubrum daqingense]